MFRRTAKARDQHEHENASPWRVEAVDPRLQAVKDVLGMLTDEGGKFFSPIRLDEISRSILYWIDQVKQ
jgi:hypothetical protein